MYNDYISALINVITDLLLNCGKALKCVALEVNTIIVVF